MLGCTARFCWLTQLMPQGAALPEGSDAAWRAALARAGLQFVCQVHTCGYKPLDGVDDPAFNNQSYVPSEDIGEHIESFREQVSAPSARADVRVCVTGG